MKNETLQALKKDSGIHSPVLLELISNVIDYAAKLDNKTQDRFVARDLDSISGLVKLASAKETNPNIVKDNTSALYALSSIIELSVSRPREYEALKFKSRAVRSIARAASDITRNLDKTASIVLCSSPNQRDLTFVASNVDGVIETLQAQFNKSFNSVDSEEMQKVWKTNVALSEALSESTLKLTGLVADCLEKGYGTRYQLANHGTKILEDNEEAIIEAIKKGTTLNTLAVTYRVPSNTLAFVLKDSSIRLGLITEQKENLLKLSDEKTPIEEIIKTLKVDESIIDAKALTTYIGQWKKEIKDEATKVRLAAEKKNQNNKSNKPKQEQEQVKPAVAEQKKPVNNKQKEVKEVAANPVVTKEKASV